MSKYTITKYTVEDIISWIKQGQIAIPEMQRPFVWKAVKVRDLLDSLYKEYPIGYIVTWKNSDVKLKDGSISDGKKVIIDGQQRITSLMAAIAGFEVVDSNYKKTRIKISFNPIEEKFEVANPIITKNTLWISDVSDIFKPDFSDIKFKREYLAKNNISESDDIALKVENSIYKLRCVLTSDIGVTELPNSMDIDTITKIFERLNSYGVTLSQADFVMSKIAANESYDGNNIRKCIDYFCHLAKNPVDYKNILLSDAQYISTDYFKKLEWIRNSTDNLYIPDYADILRVVFAYKFNRGRLYNLVSLLSGRDFTTREYNPEVEEDTFKKIKDGVLDFINKTNFQRFLMILKSIGIVNKKLIKSQNTINFAYALYLTLKGRGLSSNIIERAVRRWLVLSILTERYSSSPESKFEADIKTFYEIDDVIAYIDNIEKGMLSDAFWENVLIDKLKKTSVSSPAFIVFLMAQIKNHSKGFLSDAIEVETLLENRGDKHHIFPKNYLIKNGITKKNDYNQIANYVYTQQETNINILDKAPNVYFEEVLKQCAGGDELYGNIKNKEDLLNNLKDCSIPESVLTMDYKDYEVFLMERRILMAKTIKDYYTSL